MISSFGVVLDACTLVPVTLCDILLCAAERRLYRPFWTREILDETKRALIRNKVSEDKAQRRLSAMEGAYPEAMVEGYESLIPAMTNDQKDRHVLAAAVRGCAEVIVTANIKHFSEAALAPLGIEAKTPDTFLMDLLAFDEREVLEAVRHMSDAKTRPPLTVLDLLTRIGKSAPNFAAAALMMIESREEPAGNI